MNTVTLQVPMSKSLRDSATSVARDYGFSSLQEAARFLFNKLAKREISITVGEPTVRLSKKNEKRYLKMEKDFATGKNVYYAKNVDDFLRQLNS